MRWLKRTLLCLLPALMLGVATAWATGPVQPDPVLTPENVISIQLKALSDVENNSATNSGVAQVWAFAHPANRRVTGPLPRFTNMLMSPNYRPLIGHRSHYLRLVSQTDTKARYAIQVTSGDGAVYGYAWHLAKVAKGAYANMWMTTTVLFAGKLAQQL